MYLILEFTRVRKLCKFPTKTVRILYTSCTYIVRKLLLTNDMSIVLAVLVRSGTPDASGAKCGGWGVCQDVSLVSEVSLGGAGFFPSTV